MMTNSPEFSVLPFLVLRHIASFLEAQDLINLSATCHRCRAALNCNSIWRRFVEGCHVLEDIPCVVQPEFKIQTNEELESLCENRIYFLKKSRIVNNVKQGKFVYTFVELDRETTPLHFNASGTLRQYTLLYDDTFLIVYEAYDESDEILHLINIQNDPHFISSITIQKSRVSKDRQGYTYCKLMQNKLVVKRPSVVDIYEIILPEFRCPLLYYIDVQNYPTTYVYSNFVLTLNKDTKVIQVWDIHSGSVVKNIPPKEDGPCLYVVHSQILGHSRGIREFSLAFRWKDYVFDRAKGEINRDPISVFSYDLDKMDFSTFNIVWTKFDTLCDAYTDGNYVVFIAEREVTGVRNKFVYLISVYDYKTSNILSERLADVFNLNYTSNIRMMKNYLLISFDQSIQILDLKTLETVWEIPEYDWSDFAYWNILDQCHLVVTEKYLDKKEVWDLEKKAKVFELPVVEEGLYYFHVASTKVVFFLETVPEYNRWCILHFW